MTPYQTLKNAVQRRGGVCQAYHIRHELAAYLKTQEPALKRWGAKFWGSVMTREEWFALTQRRKKRKRRNKQGQLTYTNIEGEQVTVHPDATTEEMYSGWAAEVDEFAARCDQEEKANGYHGVF